MSEELRNNESVAEVQEVQPSEETNSAQENLAETSTQKQKSIKKTLIIGGVVLLIITIAIIAVVMYIGSSEERLFKETKDETLTLAGRLTSGDNYFCVDTLPDEYEDNASMIALRGDELCDNALEGIRYANKALGFGESVYNRMLETNYLMGRQSEENEDFIVSWTYHPDEGLEVMYEIK